MKKIKYILLLLFTFLSCLLKVDKANAATEKIVAGDFISGPYYYELEKGTRHYYEQSRFLLRSSDRAWVYCVQPFTSINEDSTYNVTEDDLATVAQISQENWKIIERIAYYGYQYNENGVDHSADKWFTAAQMLIWKYADTGINGYFTSYLHGARLESTLKAEMDEIMNLVNSHTTTPNFGNLPSEMTIGDTITLTDSNNVLKNYEVTDVSGGTVNKEGNSLKITANEVGNLSFKLQKLGNRYGEPIRLYYAVDSQNVARRGNIDPITLSYSINSKGEGYIAINKRDKETGTNPQGDATLSGARYGIFNSDGTQVEVLVTDSNGYAKSGPLTFGKYTVKELDASTGYLIDTQTYNVTIDVNEEIEEVTSNEQVKKFKFDMLKVMADERSGVIEAEPNAVFDIFLISKNQKVTTITTDNKGKANVTLPYGKYNVCQTSGTDGRGLAPCFEIDINDKDIDRIVNNGPVRARLKVVKIDKDTQEVMPIKGIKFKIKNKDTDEFVCQTTNIVQCEFETNEEGILITPQPLEAGNYALVEVEDQVVPGWLWNNEELEFAIKTNTKFTIDDTFGAILTLEFTNSRVTGEVIITKHGENFVVKDKSFTYEKIVLPNIKFGIYAAEDIYFNGKLIYNKDTLITEITTNEEGIAKADNLYLGSYYIKELENPNEDYVKNDKIYNFSLEFKDQYTPVITYELSVDNFLKKGNLKFFKIDKENKTPISDTYIEIYTENDELIYSGMTDKNGNITLEKLKVGNYYLIETKAKEGYLLSEEKINFTVKEDGEIVEVTMENQPITGKLEFTKTDFSTDEALPDTLIEIYNADSDKLIFSGRTDINGKIIIERLRYGRYYILEKEAPEGYVLNPEKMYFEIRENGEIIKSNMKNERIKGTLEFTKEDISTSKALPNTLVEIYKADTDELIFSGRTDINGKIILEGVEYGRYYILEKEAPKGYTLNPEKMYFEIKENGEIVRATMKDEKIKISVPITGSNKNYLLEISTAILIIGGSVLLVYARRRKK